MADITFFDAPQLVNETTNDYGTDFHYLFCVGYIGKDDNKEDVYAAMSGYVKDYDYKETEYEDYSAVVYNDDEGKCYTTDAQGSETYYPLPQKMLEKLNTKKAMRTEQNSVLTFLSRTIQIKIQTLTAIPLCLLMNGWKGHTPTKDISWDTLTKKWQSSFVRMTLVSISTT